MLSAVDGVFQNVANFQVKKLFLFQLQTQLYTKFERLKFEAFHFFLFF